MILVVTALLLAAVAAPWTFRWGMRFAKYVAAEDLSPLLEWLGKSCGRARLERYFSRCFSFWVLFFLPFLMLRIRAIRAASGVPVIKKTPIPWQSAIQQIAVGCVIAGGILLGTGIILNFLGAYTPEPNPPQTAVLLRRILIPAVAASLLEEWLFRGLILGLWLRFTKPWYACLGTSFFFAFLHFLGPPEGTYIPKPASPTAGFRLLETILQHFTDPLFFVTDFASLFFIGMILAWARLRTGGLWFSIGLHSGWIAAFKGYSMLHVADPDHVLRPWGIGESLRSGLIPMLALGVTAAVCHYALKHFEAKLPLNRASP